MSFTLTQPFGGTHEDGLEEALAEFYFQHGLSGRVTHEVTQEASEDGEWWPIITFTVEEEDDLFELQQAFGLPTGSPDPSECRHDSQSSDGGVWTCDSCGADLTLEALAGLVTLVKVLIDQADDLADGSRAQAAKVVEAATWFGSAQAAAGEILRRTNPFPTRPGPSTKA